MKSKISKTPIVSLSRALELLMEALREQIAKEKRKDEREEKSSKHANRKKGIESHHKDVRKEKRR